MRYRTAPRLGELLVEQGDLTRQQLEMLLMHQRDSGRPLGELAETLCRVHPRRIEAVWSRQYRQMVEHTNLDEQPIDSTTQAVVSQRQAWQFRMLPLRREEGILLLATTEARLPRASAFAASHIDEPVLLLIADEKQLLDHLMRRYPWAGAERSMQAIAQARAAENRPSAATVGMELAAVGEEG